MTHPPLAQPHPALLAYATRHRIAANDPPRSDGRLTVRVDGRWRVHLTGTVEGRTPSRIVLSARLLDLAGQLHQRSTDDLLVRLATLAAGRLKSDASGLSLDQKNQALLLMEAMPASSDLEALETGLADFVNTLAFWGHAIQAETQPSHGASLTGAPAAAPAFLSPFHPASGAHAFQTLQPPGSFAPPQVLFP